eukprot:3885275-Amphidinium_carterae.1
MELASSKDSLLSFSGVLTATLWAQRSAKTRRNFRTPEGSKISTVLALTPTKAPSAFRPHPPRQGAAASPHREGWEGKKTSEQDVYRST